MQVKKLVVVLTALALALTPVSVTAQLDPGKKPKKRGPLAYDGDTYGGKDCESRSFRRHGDTGQVTSKYKFCTFFYRYQPAKDNDPNRNFGAMWYATRVDPRNGWCIKQVKSKLGVQTSGTGKAHKRAPRAKKISAGKRKIVTTKLIVDAKGGGDKTGRLSKKWTLYPDAVKISRFKKGGFNNLLLDWRGRTKRTVSFASGVEMSWQQGGQPPSVFPELRALHVKPC